MLAHQLQTFLQQRPDDLALNFRPMQFWEMPEAQRLRAIAGFGAMLAAIEIDDALIRRPLQTEARTTIIADSMGPVMRWLQYRDQGWKPGRDHARPARELWHGYLRWMEIDDPNAGIRTETAFGRVLREIANIEKVKTKTGFRYFKLECFCPEDEQVPSSDADDLRHFEQIK